MHCVRPARNGNSDIEAYYYARCFDKSLSDSHPINSTGSRPDQPRKRPQPIEHGKLALAIEKARVAVVERRE